MVGREEGPASANDRGWKTHLAHHATLDVFRLDRIDVAKLDGVRDKLLSENLGARTQVQDHVKGNGIRPKPRRGSNPATA